jgi:hypothetical protein
MELVTRMVLSMSAYYVASDLAPRFVFALADLTHLPQGFQVLV